MLPRLLIAAAVLVTAASAHAQESGVIQRWPTRQESAPAPAPAPAAEQRRQPPQGGGGGRADGGGREGGGERVAVPRTRPVPQSAGARDRDDRDRDRDRNRGRDTVIIAPRVSPYYAYGYGRDFYPYGYGAFGLGYFYYDPYGWYGGRAPLYAYSGGVYGRGYGYDIGELRLRVSPRDAQVFVDGYFAGTVDDYDGVIQALRLESGSYHIELRLAGYESLQFDVRITPGQKITYRGELRRLP